ncbi:MAG: insulinase family protein [Elusimicrobia bacterium]|nr:insulinase family protein [Elusimicrobiota bacterium]
MNTLPRRSRAATLAVLLAALALPAAAAKTETKEKDVVRATLKNGLRVIVVRDPLAPVATTVVNYLVGSNEAPKGFPGTAHATEHIMFRGSPGLSADQLAGISAGLGGDFDADTQQGLTQYFFTMPSEDLDTALHLESIRMRGVLSTDKLWDKERGAIEQEVASDLSSPSYVFYMRLLKSMFAGTPYEHDALGTRPSFDKTTGAMLRRFHDEWYAPNNAVLVVAGDVEPAKVLASVRRYFGGIPRRRLPARPAFRFRPVAASSSTMDTDLPYGMTVYTFRFPGSDDPDYAAAQILSDALSSQRGPLYALVPEGKALFAGLDYGAFRKAGLGYAVAGFPAGADAAAQLASVRRIVADAAKNGVPADLVEAAKRREIAEAEFQKNSVSGLAMTWSQAVAGEGRRSPDDDIEAIRRVTPADVNRVARRYLDFGRAISVILSPKPSGKPVASKGFGGQESFASSKNPDVVLPEWARRTADRMSLPTSSLSPTVSVLPNGIRLIVQPLSISRTVSVYGRIDEAPKIEEAKGRDGAAGVLDQLFSYGTKDLDRIAFQKALDDIAADESAGSDFSVEVLADRFERGVQLLADNELSPALPEKAFKVVQRQTAASVAGELKSPDHLAGKALREGLFPKGDPARRETTPETVKSLTLDEVRAYYRKAYRPDMTTIVVIGDVTPEKAKDAIEKYFGAWKAEGPKPNTLFPAVPHNAPSTTNVPDSSRVQDRVTLAETLKLKRTDPDYYPLELGNHVLGGAFYATRLYRDLREKAGLVYFVGSSFDVGRTRGVYSVDYGCDPPNVSKARRIIVDDLKAMMKEPVTAHELKQAKVMLLKKIPLSESSVGRVAGGWLSRSIEGLPLDEPVRAAKIYAGLSAEDVRAAYARFLRPADLVQVVQGPAGR